jgi:hypothetical protein
MGDVFRLKYLGMDPKTRKEKSVKKENTYAKTST